MSLNHCETFDFNLPDIKIVEENRQTRGIDDSQSTSADITDNPVVNVRNSIKQTSLRHSSFRHVTHISWKDDGSLEISTNDREMADFFRKIEDRMCLGEGKDVKEVIFDYVANSLNSEEDDDENLGKNLDEKEENTEHGKLDVERCKPENIGKPYNFQHVTHCSFDRKSGFSVVTKDRKLSWFYNRKVKNKDDKNY